MQDTKRRSKHFIDKAVQGALLLRAARYWLLSLCMVAGLTMAGWLFVWPGVPGVIDDLDRLLPLANVLLVGLVVTVVLLPVVLYDLSKMTNRFVGPVYRLQRSLNDLADGKSVRPIKFRDDDYWQDLATAFNRVLDAQQRATDPSPQHETSAPAVEAEEESESLQTVY